MEKGTSNFQPRSSFNPKTQNNTKHVKHQYKVNNPGWTPHRPTQHKTGDGISSVRQSDRIYGEAQTERVHPETAALCLTDL